MATVPEDAILEIEHDHTQLDVLFEDLKVVAREGLTATDDPALLEDAQVNWTYLQEEIVRHFVREERRLFSALEVRYPDLKEALQALCAQHLTLRGSLSELGKMLKAPPQEQATSRDVFETRWQQLEALWHQHSETEWSIIRDVEARGSSVETSAAAGEDG